MHDQHAPEQRCRDHAFHVLARGEPIAQPRQQRPETRIRRVEEEVEACDRRVADIRIGLTQDRRELRLAEVHRRQGRSVDERLPAWPVARVIEEARHQRHGTRAPF
jgi:hypothetical protein